MKNLQPQEIIGEVGRIATQNLQERRKDFQEIEDSIVTLKEKFASLKNTILANADELEQLADISDKLSAGLEDGTETYTIDFIKRTKDVVDRSIASGERMKSAEDEIGIIIEDISTLFDIQRHLTMGKQLGKT